MIERPFYQYKDSSIKIKLFHDCFYNRNKVVRLQTYKIHPIAWPNEKIMGNYWGQLEQNNPGILKLNNIITSNGFSPHKNNQCYCICHTLLSALPVVAQFPFGQYPMQAWWLTRCHVHYGIDGWLNEADHYSSIAMDCWVNYWLTTDLLHIGEMIFSWSQHLSMAQCKTDVTLLLKRWITYLLHQAIKRKSMGPRQIFLLDNMAVILQTIATSAFPKIWISESVGQALFWPLINLTADIKMIFWDNKKLQAFICMNEESCQRHKRYKTAMLAS